MVSSNLCLLEKIIMYLEKRTLKSSLSSFGVSLRSLVPSMILSTISRSCSAIVLAIDSEGSNMALSHNWSNQKGPASRMFLEV